MENVTFTVHGTIAGQPCEATMTYPRCTWDGVSVHDRAELQDICRARFASWARKEYGVTLTAEERAGLDVSIG
ncbi:hypothetical protein ACFZDF_30625 [Streptomyces sp. NPDC007910]|uniref:hypothetical protein n=1 Tax=Streptomyces sp. NPDC007910 TaxID=3364790 RepID=UPI0036EEE940